MPDRPPPLLIVVSGPSGVGKDALLAGIRARDAEGGGGMEAFAVPVTMTTRAPRDGEVDGVDYRFVSAEEFERRLWAGGVAGARAGVRTLLRRPSLGAARGAGGGGVT